MVIELPKEVSVSQEVMCQEVNGETVLLDLKSESYFGLDQTGTRIWQLIQENGDLQSAFKTVLEEYSVEEEQLNTDFSDLIARLIAAGLIFEIPSSGI